MDGIFLKLVEVGGLAFALAAVGVLALLRGDVVTKKNHEALLKAKDDQIIREQTTAADAIKREREDAAAALLAERDRTNELWSLLRPMIGVAGAVVDRLDRERPTYHERG